MSRRTWNTQSISPRRSPETPLCMLCRNSLYFYERYIEVEEKDIFQLITRKSPLLFATFRPEHINRTIERQSCKLRSIDDTYMIYFLNFQLRFLTMHTGISLTKTIHIYRCSEVHVLISNNVLIWLQRNADVWWPWPGSLMSCCLGRTCTICWRTQRAKLLQPDSWLTTTSKDAILCQIIK